LIHAAAEDVISLTKLLSFVLEDKQNTVEIFAALVFRHLIALAR
jgi:hypothetical protein